MKKWIIWIWLLLLSIIVVGGSMFVLKEENYTLETDEDGYKYFKKKYTKISGKLNTRAYHGENTITNERTVTVYMNLNKIELIKLRNDNKFDKLEKTILIGNTIMR